MGYPYFSFNSFRVWHAPRVHLNVYLLGNDLPANRRFGYGCK